MARFADRGAAPPAARSAQPAGAGSGAPADTSRLPLAWLSGSVGSRWRIVARASGSGEHNSGVGRSAPGGDRNEAFWPIGTEFIAGRQVQLVTGLAEITFRSGAKVVLAAPAQFAVSSALGANLKAGKLTARVPHVASGFTVSTPSGSVADLGTEFGVEVMADGKMDVQVFVGEVAVTSAAASGSAPTGVAVHVKAGQAVRVAAGQTVIKIAARPDRFHRDLALQRDSSDLQAAAYVDFMRQLKPAVWLRMEGQGDSRTIHDEMGHAPDGLLHWQGPGSPWADGRMGKSLWLRGPRLRDYAVVPDYPKAEHDKLSVTAWVYADSRPNFATIAKNGHSTEKRGQFQLMLVPGNLTPDRNGQLRDSIDFAHCSASPTEK